VIDPAAHARLERWKLSLLDLSAANRLIDVKDGKTTIPLPGADSLRIAAALADGDALTIEPGADGGAGDVHRLRTPLANAELARRLVAIRRTARTQLADGGVHTLWLGLGRLTWCEAAPEPAPGARPDAEVTVEASPDALAGGDTVPHASAGTTEAAPVLRTAPLVLWPVELERELGGTLRIVEAPGLEPRLNLTLAEKLRREFGVALPDPGDGDELDLAAVLDTAEALAVTRPGWRLDRGAQLGIFAFAKFVMWNDLDARAGELMQSPIVAHLAAGGGLAFGQPTAAADAAVTAAPGGAPADVIAPLDADASQLAAIAAAGAGASFVLQGPPGTGKSQTIANLIVHCVAHGKTVLFVTDKRAALEVVQQRLAAVGLGEFCLELHSHKAVRAQVVAQLGRVLERAFRPVSGPNGDDGRLAELRAALDGHVAALHRVGPFGRSLHDVLGRLVELRSVPRAALAERDATGLDRPAFDRRKLAVEQLAQAAIPVEPVATHPWRASGLERWPLDGRERTVTALDAADAAAAALAQAVAGVASLVPGLVARTRDQLDALGALAALAATSPRPGAELLTQLRTARGEDIAERIALIRARGTGSLEAPRDPGSFLVLASRHRVLATEVNDRFTDSVAELDAPALWAQLRRWAHRVAPLRFLALRETRAAIGAAAMPGMLETDDARITALESVIAERAARVALGAAAAPARRWFGELGGDPLALDLAQIDAAVGWAAELRRAFDAVDVVGGEAGRAAAWRALVAQVAASPATEAPGGGELARFSQLAEAARRWRPALAALTEATGIDAVTLGAGDDHLTGLAERIEALRHALDGMRDWVAFHGARRAAQAAGVGPAVAAIERGDLGAAELAVAWERATLLAWADAELADTPALARFHGAAHHAHVAAFADLDRAALALVRARALVRLAERVPRITADPGGELGTLLHELKKQRGHRPLRRLFAEIPNLLPRLAPCLLMSPLSVAQYLDPALPRFDVVVFDEASQLPTADAIGALARGDAAVVVGDSRQLPPTRFFEAGAGALDGDDEAEAADEGVAAELESVLDECVARRLPELRLAWHYRSRHEDLIAFANQRYYGDRLQVFPTAHGSPDLGVAWRRVDGVYDRARTRQNRGEAEAVVAEVLGRLRDPAQRERSIGVVTFSRAQQELIEDLLDDARAGDPDLDAWFEAPAADRAEPVLVKNLETIQGDERDVVILSVGYGPDAAGAFPLHLGPLSQRGGERRLNVAITRAREQLLVFSSFAPEALAAATGRGVQDLAALLAFARAGGGAARLAVETRAGTSGDPGEAGELADAPPASPITAAIARALIERGWSVRHQVGCGAYKIDVAVVDPNDPDRYVLAIEHDGAAYASAPAARDRDRLRAQVLGQLGWRMHRIWSLDWWADPEREIQRAHGAIIAAVAASRQRRTAAVSSRAPAPRPARDTGRNSPARATRDPAGAESSARSARPAGGAAQAASGGSAPGTRTPARGRTSAQAVIAAGSGRTEAVTRLLGDTTAPAATGSAPVRLARNAIAIGPYLSAAIPAGRRAPDDLFAPRHLAELGKIIDQVLAAEAPMHVDLLARRVGAYFGIGRLTQRVTDQVRVALAGRGRWGDEADVVWRLDQDPAGVPAVRVAGQGASARREIDEVPLSEIAAAARIVVERAVGISANDLVRDAARLLGFSRITDRVIERVASGVRNAAERSLIRIDAGKATLPD
jgi:very-short-patch-repair endonuclease